MKRKRRFPKNKDEKPVLTKKQRLEYFAELENILKFSPPIDGLIFALKNEFHIDMIRLDKKLGERVRGYSPDSCTYNGQRNVSMRDVVLREYGERAAYLIKILL